MFECNISIPRLLEEQAVDAMFHEIIHILDRVIDHESDTICSTGMGFWLRFLGKMIHKIDITGFNILEVSTDPAIGTFSFPTFLI